MITRMFQKTVLDIKHNSSIFVKYFYHCNNVSFRNVQESIFSQSTALAYFSNERDVSKRGNIFSHQQMHTNIFKEPLLCKTTLASTIPVNQCFTVNNIRQYSSSAPVIVNPAVPFNNALWKMISESVPVEYLTEALKMLQYQTDLPWWATIVLTTILARVLISLPLTIHDYQVRAKIINLKPKLEEIKERLLMEARFNARNVSDAKTNFLRAFHKECSQLYETHNCHPLKSIAIIFLQAPVWISFSISLSNICYMLPSRNHATYQSYLEFTTGGFGWIKDLTVADPTFVLPILFGFSRLADIKIIQLLYQVKSGSKWMKYYRYFVTALTCFFVYIMAHMPAGLCLFWTTYSYCAMLQSLLLLSPKIRRLGRIPKTEFELQRPYSELYKRLTDKIVLKQK